MNMTEIYFRKLTDTSEELDELNDSLKALKKQLKNGLSEEEKRELASLYLKRINLQYRAAKTFHPFSTFGKRALSFAQKSVAEYEKSVGPLNTQVTEDNLVRFKTLLTPDLVEEIKVGKKQALGALRYRDGGLHAAGVVVFDLEIDSLGEEPIFRLDWLYVRKDFRGLGIGDSLLGAVLNVCSSCEIESVTVDFPENENFEQEYYNLFSGWHFEFEIGFAPYLMTSLKDVEETRGLKNYSKDIKPFKDFMKEPEREKFLSVIDDIDASLRDLLTSKSMVGYFDNEVSCYCLSDEGEGALLLAHRAPSGAVKIENIVFTPKNEGLVTDLISFFALESKKKFEGEDHISIPVEAGPLGDFLDNNFKKQLREIVTEGALFAPGIDENVNVDMAARLLSAAAA